MITDCNGECGICITSCFYKPKKERYIILWNRQLPDFKVVGHSIWKNGDMIATEHNGLFIKLKQ